MTRLQQQANPALDKPAARLGLAGSGVLGPILRGLGGHLTITVAKDEILEGVRIYSRRENNFEQQLLSRGTWTHNQDGSRQWDADIEYGVDTDFGETGMRAVRNFLEWTIRKRHVVNPSGAVVGEKFYSVDDDDALRSWSDEKLRRNRAFFTPRNYSLGAASSVAGEVIEASGLTWRDDNSTLWVVSDDRLLSVYNRELEYVRGPISLPSSVFADPEAIVYMGSDRFAVLDEGEDGTRSPKIHLFHLKFGQDTVDLTNLITYELNDVEEFAGGLGAEGLAYDPVSGKFYVGTQPTGSSEGGLWEIDTSVRDTDGNPQQTRLFYWYDKMVSPGHLGSGAVLGDLHFSSTLAGGQVRKSIFCHFREPDGGGSPNHKRVIQFDLENSLYIDTYQHNLGGKWEGFTISPDLEDLFFVREDGGQNVQRHDHTEYETTEKFTRQFYVKDLPQTRGLYINGQEAQEGEARVYIDPNGTTKYSRDATIGISVLPNFGDEFYQIHEAKGNYGQQIGNKLYRKVGGVPTLVQYYGARRGNRFAQTLRNVGGVKTVEVFFDNVSTPIVEETLIENLAGVYIDAPSPGLHFIRVRLRAEEGSSLFRSIVGFVRFLQFSCP